MEKKFRRLNTKQRTAFILTTIIPICLGVLVLKIINVRMLFSMFSGIWCLILLILFVISNYFVIRKEMKLIEKIILWFVVFIVYAFIMFVSLLLTKNINKVAYYDVHALDYYNENLIDEPVFSSVKDLGDYVSIEGHHIKYHQAIFQTETKVLICKYDAGEYEIIKEGLEESFILETDMIIYDSYEKYIELFPEIYIEDYYFRFLECSSKDYNTYYPKSTAFLVTNDITCEIGIVTSYDQDLDYIPDLEKHILNDCCWSFVR